MLEFIKAHDDVLALRVGGAITGADLDAMIERLHQSMEQHDTVHVYVETRSLDGIEIAELRSHLAEVLPMLGQLRQFGRVAVVADQAWVRVASRLESAMLPGISYRVFEPEDRDEALAWVQGNRAVRAAG